MLRFRSRESPYAMRINTLAPPPADYDNQLNGPTPVANGSGSCPLEENPQSQTDFICHGLFWYYSQLTRIFHTFRFLSGYFSRLLRQSRRFNPDISLSQGKIAVPDEIVNLFFDDFKTGPSEQITPLFGRADMLAA